MTHTIAIMNQKGGVGKTTTAVNLSASLAILGYKTLLIDADAQSNSSISFGMSINSNKTNENFYEFLILGAPLQKLVKPTMINNLSILPTNDNLYAADLDLFEMGNKESILRERLKGQIENYNFVIIDSPPALSPLTINIMSAVDKIVVPLKADFLALQGLAILLNTYKRIKLNYNKNISLLGILLTMYNQNYNICRDVLADLEKANISNFIFKNKIPQNVKIAESPSFSLPVIIHDPKSQGAISYQNFTLELIQRINNNN